MSAFAEFFLVAAIIYLWESLLWLPIRAVVLRRKWIGKRWHFIRPGHWFATRETGLVTMFPLLPDGGLALCQTPPLRVMDSEQVAIEVTGSEPLIRRLTDWSEIRVESHWLWIGNQKVRISSPRALDALWRAKRLGKTPAEAVDALWTACLRPTHAVREWRRWRLVSAPILPVSFLLTTGFFFLLPFTFIKAGVLPMLVVLLGLWVLMLITACRLWWLGSRVYPSVRSEFRMDALLSLLIPFHSMRAMEIASVHAMASSHPAALLIGTGDVDSPWLAELIREILHPRPGTPADARQSQYLRPLLAKALSRFNKSLEDYETVPAREDDPGAMSYCPRCHSLFGREAATCPDCREVPLKDFP